MRTLLICHVEEEFAFACNRLDLQANAIRSLANLYDHIIVIQFNLSNFYQCFEDLHREEWIYGYDKEYYDSEGTTNVEDEDYIRVSTDHEWALIDTWMKQLPKYHKYHLVGGARWECLQDVYDICKHLQLDIHILEDYCYGV